MNSTKRTQELIKNKANSRKSPNPRATQADPPASQEQPKLTHREPKPNPQSIYSLSLPELADGKWTIPENARKGLPTYRDTASSHDIWQALAVIAALTLLFEWIRWGQAAKRITSSASSLKKAA